MTLNIYNHPYMQSIQLNYMDYIMVTMQVAILKYYTKLPIS